MELFRDIADVRRRQHVVEFAERVIRGQRLGIEHGNCCRMSRDNGVRSRMTQTTSKRPGDPADCRFGVVRRSIEIKGYSLESGSAICSSERISASTPNAASATAAPSISSAAKMYPPAS